MRGSRFTGQQRLALPAGQGTPVAVGQPPGGDQRAEVLPLEGKVWGLRFSEGRQLEEETPGGAGWWWI